MSRSFNPANAQSIFDRLNALSKTTALSDHQSRMLELAIRTIDNGGVLAPKPAAWSKEMLDYLCDLIADGYSFAQAGVALGKSKSACISQFHTIRKDMGWQAS